MRLHDTPKIHFDSRSYAQYLSPLYNILPNTPMLESKGYRPLKMTFEDQLHALIFSHLQEHESARDLIQHLKEDDFVKEYIAPDGGISRSSFSEAINLIRILTFCRMRINILCAGLKSKPHV